MSRKKRWTKHYNTPLTIKALEKYLEGILIHKGNYSGPIGLVYENNNYEVYALPNGARTGREGWELFNKTINEQYEKVV